MRFPGIRFINSWRFFPLYTRCLPYFASFSKLCFLGCLWIRGLNSLGRLRLGALRPAVSLLAPLSLVFGLGPWFCFLRRAHCQLLQSLSDDGSCGLFLLQRHRSPPPPTMGSLRGGATARGVVAGIDLA